MKIPSRYSSVMELRQQTPQPLRTLAGVFTVGAVLLVWWALTRGAVAEERIISPALLPSPAEVVRSFGSLWYERALMQSVAASLQRVLIGFGLAILVGVPAGVVAASWRLFEAGSAPFEPRSCSAATCRWPR